MAIVRVNPNLEAELTGSLFSHGPMEQVLGGVADDIAAHARAIARREFYRCGDYTRGIRAEHGINEHGELVGRAVATDFKSHWAEWGWKQRSGGTRARHIMLRAAERAGYAVVARGLGGRNGPVIGRRALPATPRAMVGGR